MTFLIVINRGMKDKERKFTQHDGLKYRWLQYKERIENGYFPSTTQIYWYDDEGMQQAVFVAEIEKIELFDYNSDLEMAMSSEISDISRYLMQKNEDLYKRL